MSEVRTEPQPSSPRSGEVARSAEGADRNSPDRADGNGLVPAARPRFKVVVHRLDGGLEEGESDSRKFTPQGYPIYSPAYPEKARFTPVDDIKYVVFGSLDDPTLDNRPGDQTD